MDALGVTFDMTITLYIIFKNLTFKMLNATTMPDFAEHALFYQDQSLSIRKKSLVTEIVFLHWWLNLDYRNLNRFAFDLEAFSFIVTIKNLKVILKCMMSITIQ